MSERERNRAEQRERVLDAAAQLFAERGYGGTGMRQIAAEAGVSLSMINYYFGSKQKLIEELVASVQHNYLTVAREAMTTHDNVEDRIRAFVRGVVQMARRLGPRMRVTFLELPKEAPGLLDQKAARIGKFAGLMAANVLGPLGRLEDMPLLGPGMGSMIMSHFMARPLVERVSGPLPDDDAFYDRYAEVIANQILYGLVGTPPEAPLTSAAVSDTPD